MDSAVTLSQDWERVYAVYGLEATTSVYMPPPPGEAGPVRPGREGAGLWKSPQEKGEV